MSSSLSSVAKIDARLAELPADSLRYRVLVALRQFRASWVELGRLLNETVYGGDYREYGYDDFEVYCARELGLKKPTVQKLMISYNYMRKYEAKRLAVIEDGGAAGDMAVPDFQTVELLDRVRRQEAVPEEEVEEIHGRVFDEAGDAEEVTIRRELRQKLTPPRQKADTIDAGGGRRKSLAGVLKAARELRRQLAQAGAVPGGLRERLEAALVELESLEE